MKSEVSCAIAVAAAVSLSLPQVLAASRTDCGAVAGQCEPQRTMWLSPQPLAPKIVSKGQDEGGIAGAPTAQFLSTNSEPEADGPHELAYTPDGSAILVVHRDTDNVTFLDVNTRIVTHTVAVGDFPVDVEVAPNGQVAVVANVFGNSVSMRARTILADSLNAAPESATPRERRQRRSKPTASVMAERRARVAALLREAQRLCGSGSDC